MGCTRTTAGRRCHLGLLCLIVLCLGVITTTQASASPRSEICRRLDRTPRVYLLGSSTMGSVLGPMLQKELKKRWGIQAKRWGKASSGLARPDFHDWPEKVPNLMRRHRPDYVVVSLGTNDHQALKTKKGWIRTSNERWATSYKQRVLIMLRRLSGRDRRRAIVWLGPTNFSSNNAKKLGPKLNNLVREAIAEFDGPAIFVDARRATSNKKGEPGVTYRHPKKGVRPMRTSDGIHLTTEAVRTLLAAPVYEAFAPCWDGDVANRDALREQRKEERLAKRKAKRDTAAKASAKPAGDAPPEERRPVPQKVTSRRPQRAEQSPVRPPLPAASQAA
jgi:lysophospholipase L1-like esterase